MKLNRTFLGFVLILLLLSACTNQPSTQLPEPAETTVDGSSTEIHDEISDYFVLIPVDSVKELSNEEIARKMFTSWLEHFTSSSISDPYRLDDFKINKVELPTNYQYCVKDLGIEFIASIDFSVQESVIPCPNWDAGNGEIGANRWVNHKLFFITVFKRDNSYSFRLKGFPPCDGNSVDGSPAP